MAKKTKQNGTLCSSDCRWKTIHIEYLKSMSSLKSLENSTNLDQAEVFSFIRLEVIRV